MELGEDIELFCVVQDFCLVAVRVAKKDILSYKTKPSLALIEFSDMPCKSLTS